jgi:predicted nucleotidyltransferase
MRLRKDEVSAIKKAFYDVFETGEIYLFGSRVDDNKRGGDIDLYLCPTKKQKNMHQQKIKFLVQLDSLIGEQKIDVIIAKDKNRLIERIALRDGIAL